MIATWKRALCGLGVWALMSAAASAQTAPPSINPPPASSLGNPYANPYLNPFMNPAMMQRQTDPGATLLYMWGANQMAGGIGSGRLSSSRPGESSRRQPAEMPVSAIRPGAAANHYFQRGLRQGPAAEAKTGRYGRQNRYFATNGR